ncbi:MAG: NifB/NifX family molybdenum-iron cluster-binding protein [Sedimentisphaerales bacterium]|nr:NifB/NifX family molybdenum-iron cluster-binding protein [Sedimentisphaerales bacterium]
MKIAITSEGPTIESTMDKRFGRARYFVLVDSETNSFSVEANTQNMNMAQGAGIQAGRNVADLGAQVLITGNVGPKAFKVLQAAGIQIFLAEEDMTVAQALQSFKAGKLHMIEQANVEGHWIQ